MRAVIMDCDVCSLKSGALEVKMKNVTLLLLVIVLFLFFLFFWVVFCGLAPPFAYYWSPFLMLTLQIITDLPIWFLSDLCMTVWFAGLTLYWLIPLFYFILIDNKKTAKTEKENNLSITIYKKDTDFCMAFSLFQFYP
jgi:hypothetical protein